VSTEGSEKVVLFQDMHQIIAFYDPALAESKKSDYATCKRCRWLYYCLDGFLEKVPITRQLEQVFYRYKAWGFTHFYVETVSFQKLLKMNYRDMQAQHPDCQFVIIGVDHHHNKEKRISTLEPLITNGYLLFSDSLPSLFIDQLTQFPTTYEDGPDALQGAVAQLKKTYEPGLLGMPIQVGNGPNMHRRF
jgi:predicted phage terminase large subunit-like protein